MGGTVQAKSGWIRDKDSLTMAKLLRDLRWILPASLILGLALSLLGPGTWWIGWLAYTLLLLSGLAALSALWRSSDASTKIGWMLLLAVVLRLGLGMAFSYVLPAFGNDTPVQKAGYIFSDAYKRDSQAWELADSHDSLLKAFDKTSTNDQYGGLLFGSSFLYRFISPDAHRPWLIILLAASVSGIGVALAYKASRRAWGEAVALPVGWIMALFPEAVLLGSSQMREPFLLAFIAMMFWGAVIQADDRRTAFLWMGGGLIGLLFFHPGVAFAAMVVLAGWVWLNGRARHISGWVGVAILAALALATVLFAWAISNSTPIKGGLLATLVNWLRYTVQWDSSVLELNSGWVQTIFSHIPNAFHLPFIIIYGVLQPVLPAAIGDVQAVWPMQMVGILRGLGWFALLPLLIYGPISLRRISDKRERLAWLWLWVAMVVWIIISSARGGGDQWDNPRYRATLLLFQAALAVQVVRMEIANQSRGLLRVLEVEAVFVVCFSAWTISRYDANPYLLPLGSAVIAFVSFSLLILICDWLWGRHLQKKRKSLGGAVG
jgi:4-amino-4-deoxy-L-arabinose transferase-like glycosyltransferase